MARTRLIKPDFFIDPDIGDLTVNARYLFSGLWCHADKEGRLVYEPRKLKVVIFPYDTVSMEKLIDELSKKPFLNLYSINDVTYIQIINWEKHQSPHHTEKDSIIPPYNGSLTVKKPLLLGATQDAPFNIRYQDKVKVKVFSHPTLEEIKNYCLERKNGVDPSKFFNHYETTEWMRGKNKIKNWKACVHTWEKDIVKVPVKPIPKNETLEKMKQWEKESK